MPHLVVWLAQQLIHVKPAGSYEGRVGVGDVTGGVGGGQQGFRDMVLALRDGLIVSHCAGSGDWCAKAGRGDRLRQRRLLGQGIGPTKLEVHHGQKRRPGQGR